LSRFPAGGAGASKKLFRRSFTKLFWCMCVCVCVCVFGRDGGRETDRERERERERERNNLCGCCVCARARARERDSVCETICVAAVYARACEVPQKKR
jgi:hypothetical protein